MPRRTTIFSRSRIVHIVNRGTGQQAIFRAEADNAMFMRIVNEEATRLGITIIAIVLMVNHFHLVIEPSADNVVSTFMHNVCYRYARYFNRTYDRSGTLFEGRFKDKPVETDEYLYQVCRYVHANPVVAGLCAAPEDWPWSNFLEFIGKRNLLPHDPTLQLRYVPDIHQYRARVLEQCQAKRILDPTLERDIWRHRME